jgi:hypothetical protein
MSQSINFICFLREWWQNATGVIDFAGVRMNYDDKLDMFNWWIEWGELLMSYILCKLLCKKIGFMIFKGSQFTFGIFDKEKLHIYDFWVLKNIYVKLVYYVHFLTMIH